MVRNGSPIQAWRHSLIQPARTPEQRASLLEWASIKAKVTGHDIVGACPFEAFAVIRRDKLVAAIFLANFRSGDAEVSVVGEKGWLSRGVCREFFSFCFKFAGLNRITAFVARKNKPSRQLVEGLGFTLEGVRRKAIGGRSDAIMYGLLAKNCRWI